MLKVLFSMFMVLNLVHFAFAKDAMKPAKAVELPKISEGELAVFDGEKYKKFRIFTEEGLSFSEDCKVKSGKMKCLAYLASVTKLDKALNLEPRISPASLLCTHLEGVSYLAINFKKEELNYCEFSDGSYVGSWALFYKFFPKNIIK